LPELPDLRLPTDADALLLDMARVDSSGRLSARGLLRALSWPAGGRVDIAVVDDALVVGSARASLHVVGSRGALALPTAARQMCGIAAGEPVLLVACPRQDVLVVHAARTVLRLISEHHTRLAAGSRAEGAGESGGAGDGG